MRNNTQAITISSAPSSDAPTMSSREIAGLTGKAHKNVIRDIEAMIAEIEKDGSDLSHQTKTEGYTIERDSRGYVSVIHLTRDLTYTLTLGYDAARRLKVVRRWMELEAAPTTRAVPTSFREALLLAAEQQEKIEAQEKQLAIVQPKAAALDDLAGMEGAHNLRWAAAECQMKEKDFVASLIRVGWCYRQTVTGRLTVYAAARDAGYMTVKNVQIQHKSGEREGVGQPMLTQRGLAKIMMKLAAEREKQFRTAPFVQPRERVS